MKELITGYAYDDESTEQAVKEVEDKFGYVIDPHGAVGYLALTEWQKAHPNTRGVILETAHPSKFKLSGLRRWRTGRKRLLLWG